MTRKHFEEIACVINAHLNSSKFNEEEEKIVSDFLLDLCHSFQGMNSNFDKTKFLRKCKE